MSALDAQSPERLALANRLLDALDFDNTSRRFRSRQMPGVSDEGRTAMDAIASIEEKALTPEKLRPPVAKAYASLFSEDELRRLIAFYESPIGRRYTAVQPQIADSMQRVISEAFEEYGDELKKTLLPPGMFEPPG
jgi:hypothetical protein